MNLFDILTNPIMILVVIGILTKVFKNQQSGDQKSRQPSPKLDPMHPKHFEEKRAYQSRPNLDEMPVTFDKEISYQSKVYEPLEAMVKTEINEASLTQHQSEKQVAQKSKPKKAPNHKKRSSLQGIRSSNAVEGVIWAEVLGPPRAHKKWSHK